MSIGLQKVQSGDPLEIPATTFNAFIDAAVDHRQRQRSSTQTARDAMRQAGIVLVKNSSGADRGRFDILGVDGPLFTQTDSADEFKNRVALYGVTPAESSHLGAFVILLEPIDSGQIGRAMASGVCAVKIDVQDANHTCADVNDGQAGSLRSGPVGAAAILWKESGTGEKWAIVRLGGADRATVRVSDNDSTAKYLKDKLVGDDGTGDNVKVTLTEQNDGGDETLKIEIAKIDIAGGGGIDMSVCHRIKIPDGSLGGAYTFSADDWRGRVLTCRLQVVYTNSPSTVQWGGGATSGLTRFFGSTYAGADKKLVYVTGGFPGVVLNGGTGHLHWVWDDNNSGMDLYAVCLIQATEPKTTDDYTV